MGNVSHMHQIENINSALFKNDIPKECIIILSINLHTLK